jgi:hypothetical protein
LYLGLAFAEDASYSPAIGLFLCACPTQRAAACCAVMAIEDLSAVFVKILGEFRQRYVLTYTAQGVAGPGWHALQVRVNRRGPIVKARPGYQVEPR